MTTPCAGVLRDDSPWEARDMEVEIDGEERLLCSWHSQVWEQHHVLKPPPRKRGRSCRSTPRRSFEPEPDPSRSRRSPPTGSFPCRHERRRAENAPRARRGHDRGALRGHRGRSARGADERDQGPQDTLPLMPGSVRGPPPRSRRLDLRGEGAARPRRLATEARARADLGELGARGST